MQTITIIKQHSSPQLAHLYEHLFLERIYGFFHEHRLFPLLDYSTEGMTFRRGGVVLVSIDLYTPEARRLKDELQKLHIDLDPKDDYRAVSTNLQQMMTEMPEQLEITDKHAVIDELITLDQAEWQHIDDFDMLDMTTIRRKNSPLFLGTTDRREPKKFYITLTLDTDFVRQSPYSLPLFARMYRIFLCEAINRFMEKTGIYDDLIYVRRKPSATITLPLLILHRFDQKIIPQEIIEFGQELATYMFTDDTISRFIHDAHSVNYHTDSHLAPNLERIISETGIVIGSNGWRKIATAELIGEILSHTSIEVRIGRQKSFAPLIKK